MRTPLELAQYDLARMVEFIRACESGETAFPVVESNTHAAAALVGRLSALVDEDRGP